MKCSINAVHPICKYTEGFYMITSYSRAGRLNRNNFDLGLDFYLV